MKINLYLPVTCLSGGTFIAFEYATRLKQRGHDVACYYNAEPSCKPSITFIGRFKNTALGLYLRCIKSKLYAIHDITELRKRYPMIPIKTVSDLKKKNVRFADAGLAVSWPSSYMLYDDTKTQNKVYLIQDFEDWDVEGKGRASYMLPLQKVVISHSINVKLKSEMNLGPYPVVYNGLDLNIYKNTNRNFIKNPNEITCAMLYSNGERKGCDIGLYAYRKILKKYPGIKLIMFGIPKRPNLEFDFEYYQAASQSKVVEIYKKADIFIWPSIWEGWGLTAIEAMACKCVVVGSNTASMSEIGEDSVNALLSEPNDKEALLINLIKAVEDADLRKKLVDNASVSVQKLSWESSLNQMEKYLQGKTHNIKKRNA